MSIARHLSSEIPKLNSFGKDFNNEFSVSTEVSDNGHIANTSHLREQIYQDLRWSQPHDEDAKRSQDGLNSVSLVEKPLASTWWLLGTQGCHLCDDAENILRLFCRVAPIRYKKIDIIYLTEPLMLQFAPLIPVILTPTRQLNYPFSVLELHHLL